MSARRLSQLQTVSIVCAAALTCGATCLDARWASEPGSEHGVFHGDLILECSVRTGSDGNADFAALKKTLAEKVSADGHIHAGPSESAMDGMRGSLWDVSHTISDDGNAMTVREIAILATDGESRLVYETHSKEVIASGMAGYLKAVGFSARVSRRSANEIQIQFRNEVWVKRPWYALDLLFAPIAKSICLKKMKKVEQTILPWMERALVSHGG